MRENVQLCQLCKDLRADCGMCKKVAYLARLLGIAINRSSLDSELV